MNNQREARKRILRDLSLGATAAAFLPIPVAVLLGPSWLRLEVFSFVALPAIVGVALFGFLLGKAKESRSFQILGSFVGGLLGIGVACLLPFAAAFYLATPAPSPRPYLSNAKYVSVYAGSYGLGRATTYTVTSSMLTLQRYFSREMSRYCMTRWHFHLHSEPSTYYAAGCKIRRFGAEQFFSVTLTPLSNHEIEVYQEVIWEDL